MSDPNRIQELRAALRNHLEENMNMYAPLPGGDVQDEVRAGAEEWLAKSSDLSDAERIRIVEDVMEDLFGGETLQ